MASSQHNLDEHHVSQRKSPDVQPYERNIVASSPVISHLNSHGQPHYDEWQASHFSNPYAQHVQPYQHYPQQHHPFGANYESAAWQPQQGEIEGHMNQAMAPQTFGSYATSNDFAPNGYNSSSPYGAFRLSNDYSPGLAPSLHYSNPNLYGQTISPQELHRQPPQTFNESSRAQNDMAMPPSTYTLQALSNLASDVRNSQGVPVIQSNASPQLLSQTSRTTQSPQNPTPIRLISPTAQQLPSSTWNGKLSIRDTNVVCTQTESVPFEGTYSVVVTKDPADFPPIINTALPKYKARPSTKELRQNAPNLSTVPRQSKKRNLTEVKSPRPLKQNVPLTQDMNLVQKSSEKTQISTPSAVSSENSETESSSDESSEEEEEQEEKIPLPSERPASDVGGYEYDTIKALWLPTNKSSTLETIRASMQKFWDVLKPIGDKWTRVAADLKKAEAEQRKDDVSRLKRSQEGVRRLFEVVVTTGIKYGNAQVLSPLGKHPPVLLIIQKFVLDRAMNNDTNGSLIKSIINFLKLFKDLDEETLETLKLTKPLTRLAKKGDAEIQALIRSIFESAAIVSKKSDNLSKTPVDPSLRPNSVPVQNVPTGIKKLPSSGASINGIKRVREMELSDSHPNKRPISSVTPSEKGGNRTPLVQDNRATSSVKTTSNFIPPRPLAFASKPLKSTNKTTQVSSVQPSSQKLYSQTTVLPAKKAPVSTAASAPAKPAFSFMEAMAALTNPKPAAPVADTKAEGPAETEEEKAKRLRRESRRRLRVSFKPDDSLVEIRLFTHDQAEEIGREHNLLKDAKDAAEEGKMFKRHIDQGSLEEDEDGDNIESAMAWRPLTPLSFPSVEGKEEKGFIKRGGRNEVNSPESKMQQQREASTLMVVYTRQSDIPPTPREPSGLQPVHLLPSSDRFGEPRSLTRVCISVHFTVIRQCTDKTDFRNGKQLI